MKTVRFGIIGCGMMGREFASVTARWCHLLETEVRPEIVAICGRRATSFDWFERNFPSIRQTTLDYREMLTNPEVDAVYVAVPHHLHREIYCAVIQSGKHLMGEKPFGMDLEANQAISDCLRQHPRVFARCSSQLHFFPGAQRMATLLEKNAFGRIITARTGFLHSSDLDPEKPINWKRIVAHNGEYGCMGDLGLHICLLPFRAGWVPLNVRAILSNIVKERPDGKGGRAPCNTWDNATLLCETQAADGGDTFPWTLETHRISPGERNTWYIEILGTKTSARFSIREPKKFEILEYGGKDQVWGCIQNGYETPFPTITGLNFEFGFPDAFLQMWTAFIHELLQAKPLRKFTGCATPEEAAMSHRLFTAALKSQQCGKVEAIPAQ